MNPLPSKLLAVLTIYVVVAGRASAAAEQFDGPMSREVLERYLARSISMEGLLNGRGDFDDNVRMLKQIGAKFIGRSLCLWGGESEFQRNLERAKKLITKVSEAVP